MNKASIKAHEEDAQTAAKTHQVKVSSRPFESKPDNKTPEGKQDLAAINKEMAYTESQEMTLKELADQVTSGYTFQVGEYKRVFTTEQQSDLKLLAQDDPKQYRIERSKVRPQRVKTSLIVIDVDDECADYDPEEVIDYIHPNLAYYTFSHRLWSEKSGKIQNAYRLIFELDKEVNPELAKFIEGAIVERLRIRFSEIDERKDANGKPLGEIAGTSSNIFIFGSQHHDYYYFPNIDPLPTDDFYKEWLFQDSANELNRLMTNVVNRGYAPAGEAELMDVAEHFSSHGGWIPDNQQWAGVNYAIARECKAQGMPEDRTLQILSTFDTDDQPLSYYKQFLEDDPNREKKMTLGSLFYYADELTGYKRKDKYRFFNPEKKQEDADTTPVETRSFKQYIDADFMEEVMDAPEKRILIEAPTGSGKTTSVIKGGRQYLESHPDDLIYLALPTTPLAEQTAENNELGRAIYGNQNVRKTLENNRSLTGKNIFVGTYDKTPIVAKELLKKGKNLILVVDEMHKTVSDYNFRGSSIRKMLAVADREDVKLIGLSGTPQEITPQEFDKTYQVKLTDAEKPYSHIYFLIHHGSSSYTAHQDTSYTAAPYESALVELIENQVNQGIKVLAFVQNKESIDTVARTLRRDGLAVETISSDSKNSSTYMRLLKSEQFPKDKQVILTTSILADGINIKNDSENYVIVLAPDRQKSRFYNISTVKQIAHRFRNKYKGILMPIAINPELEQSNPDRLENDRLYNLEGTYQFLLEKGEALQEYLRASFEGNFYDGLVLSSLEKAMGLASEIHLVKKEDRLSPKAIEFALKEREKKERGLISYNEEAVERLEEEEKLILHIDKRAIRKTATGMAERYYSYFPYAYMHAIVDALGIDYTEMFLSNFVEDNSVEERMHISAEVSRLNQFKNTEEKFKCNNLRFILTRETYDKLRFDYATEGRIREDKEPARSLKEAMNKHQYAAMLSLIPFCEYGQAMNELPQVTAYRNRYSLRKEIEAVVTIEKYKRNTGRPHPNEIVLRALAEVFSEHSWKVVKSSEEDDFIDLIASEVYTRLNKNYNKRDIKKVYRDYFINDSERTKIDGRRCRVKYNYRIVTPKDIAKKHNFNTQEVHEMMTNFEYDM